MNILDTFISEIVAHEISESSNKELSLNDLKRLDNIEGTILHSDQGSTYTSYDFFALARKKALSEVCPEKEHQLITPL